MIKPMLLSLAALSAGIASSASAEEFVILMEEGAFYPEISYLVPGDTVIFTNNNDGTVEAIASDTSWRSGQLGIGDSFALSVTGDTTRVFSYASNPEIVGTISFDLAPLGNVDEDGAGGSDEDFEVTN